MKGFLIVLALLVVCAGCVFMGYDTRHNAFATSFGVGAPWLMSQDERDILQPFITKQLQEFKKRVADVQAVTCNDADCMAKKLADFQATKKALDDAVDAASVFDFDVTIPPLAPTPVPDSHS